MPEPFSAPEPLPPDTSAAVPVESPLPVQLPQVFRGLRIVVSSTLLSRLLGMFRDIATAGLFGLGPVMDAFAFAFRIPNLTRRLFGEGALSAAFLPAFVHELEQPDGQRRAWELATSVLVTLAVTLSLLVLVGELLLLTALHGQATDPANRLLLGLTAVMLPYALLICLTAQLSAVLHAVGRFTWSALVPVVLNVCWIASIYLVTPWFAPDREAQAYALGACVLIAGILQFWLLCPSLLRLGYRAQWNWRARLPALRQILSAMLPVTLGLSITQINTVLDSLIAWSFSQPVGATATMPLPGGPAYPLQAGAVSALYYGERLYQFPLGVFGVALGTVLFPLLTRHAARGEFDRLARDLTLGLQLVLAIGIPASVGLVVLAQPITELLFLRGEFDLQAADRTARMISAYGAGVWAYCAIPLLYRGFYAVGDRRFPVRIGLLTLGLDLLLNLSLIWPLAEQGLACSTAVSASLQAGVLAWMIQSRVGRLDWPRLRNTFWKAVVASAVMGGVCFGLMRLLPATDSFVTRAIAVCVPVGAAIVVYGLSAWGLRLEEFWLLFRNRDRLDE